MNNIIIGLLGVSFGLWGLTVWWWSFAELLRGLVPLALILFGVVALGAGVSQIRTGKKIDDDLIGDKE